MKGNKKQQTGLQSIQLCRHKLLIATVKTCICDNN